MTLVFIKTCARDEERVRYTVGSLVNHGHVPVVATDPSDVDLRSTLRAMWPGTVVVLDDSYWPEAAEIKNPYLRQQYVKHVAPIFLERDLFIIDSDMTPDPAFSVPIHKRWHYATPPPRHLSGACRAWEETYRRYVGPLVSEQGDYMRQQLGWYVSQALATAFKDRVERHVRSPLYNVMKRAQSAGLPWSEFQFLGMFAHNTGGYGYEFDPNPQPGWCFHFPSSEPLMRWQRRALEVAAWEAAGG